jgi:hypothetical protein
LFSQTVVERLIEAPIRVTGNGDSDLGHEVENCAEPFHGATKICILFSSNRFVATA